MALARHSTAQLSMEDHASADPELLQAAAEGAARYAQEAVHAAKCHPGVTRAVGDDVEPANPASFGAYDAEEAGGRHRTRTCDLAGVIRAL